MASDVYGGGPNRGLAMQKVNAPAIGMMITSGLAGLWALVSVVLNLLGAGINMSSLGGSSGGSDAIATMTSGVVGVVFALLGLALCGLTFYGAMKMRALQSYPLAITSAVLSILPCVFPCCCISLPIGIWALVVLLDQNVKASFV